MYLPTPNESHYEPVPAGTHLAVCTRIIDLGTQKTIYQGEAKTAHKIMLTWETPDERMEDRRPYTISQRYTWSMSDKATLRKHLEAWRGAAFTDADFGPEGFDIRNVLGKPCILTIVHQAKDGKTYANISSVGKIMRGMETPQPENELIYLWLHPERWDPQVFDRLSEGLRQVITASPEYHELMRSLDKARHQAASPSHGDLDDDIPF